MDFSYIIHKDAWWYFAQPDKEVALTIQHEGADSCSEFTVVEREFGVKVSIFSDAWSAFTAAPEFFKGLSELGNNSSVEDVVELMNTLGWADKTPRVNPND